MRQMRTIDEAAAFMRRTDPHTAVTKTALRRLVTSGQIPSVRVGTKYLIDLGVLDEFFGGQTAKEQTIQSGTIFLFAIHDLGLFQDITVRCGMKTKKPPPVLQH